jgi:hypothetical protein
MTMPSIPKGREDTPVAIYYHLLRGDPDDVEIKERAGRLGYTIENGVLSGEGEAYNFNKDSVKARLSVAGRDIAATAGGMAGGMAGAASPVPGGMYVGGASGAMATGSAYDAAMETMHPSNTPMSEQVSQVRDELGVEVAAGALGRGVEAASPFVQSAFTTVKNGVSGVVGRILNEQPAHKVLNPREEIGEILESIRLGRGEDIDTVPDSDVIAAARSMGIEIPADFSSSSKAYQQVVQALRGSGGSALKQQELNAVESLSRELDDTFEMLGREDVGAISHDLKGMWTRQTARAKNIADQLYPKIRQAIPARIGNSRVTQKPLSVNEMLEAKRQEGPLMGGYKKLDSMLKGQENVTYAYLDNMRKQIGNAYGITPKGEFADATTHELGEIYSALMADQMRFARAFGLDREFALASKVAARKIDLDTKMIDTFGKDLQGTLGKAVQAASTGAKTGDVAGINRLIEMVPGKFKDRVAVSALDSYLTGNKGKLGKSFVERYEKFIATPSVKNKLYQHIPKEAQARMENVYKVTKAMYGALDQKKNSSLARSMIFAMDKESGFLGRVFGAALTSAIATTTRTVGAFGVKGALQSSPHGSKMVQMADDLLASPKFIGMMEAGVAGRDIAAAEKALYGTPQWRRWAGMQPREVSDVIASQGIFKYLVPNVEMDMERPDRTPGFAPM